MKERPILFSAPMVRAILAGTKTQTRRVVKPPHDMLMAGGATLDQLARVPFAAGETLWVKETWRPSTAHSCAPGACDCADVMVRYEADGAERYVDERDIPKEWLMPKAATRGNVTPLFMPRWASRIALAVTGVRAESLWSISDDDAKAEGVEPRRPPGAAVIETAPVTLSHVVSFRELWCEINGNESWDSNPLVWVVSFTRKP